MMLYRILLELLDVNESIIEKFYVNEFIYYTRSWIGYAKSLNDTYSVEVDANNTEYIDFRF